MTEYPTLTALMSGREPGSVKVRSAQWRPDEWARVGTFRDDGKWFALVEDGNQLLVDDNDGPWLIVSEDAPALDTLRLEIAARVLAGVHANRDTEFLWSNRHAYALAEADALIAEARK